MAAAIELGGTITGEHGVGRAKASALPDQLGPDVMALTRRIKDALDPDGILNPGRDPVPLSAVASATISASSAPLGPGEYAGRQPPAYTSRAIGSAPRKDDGRPPS